MRCRKVKKYLEQYADDASGLGMKRNVREHVAACRDCMDTLEYLESYKKKMNALKHQNAPDGFLAGINRRIDEPSFFRKAARALFYPLKIKIPLEAAGVLASVLVILYIYYPVKYIEKTPFPVALLERRISQHKHQNIRQKEVSKPAESIAPGAGTASKDDIGKAQTAVIAENKTAAPKIKKIIMPKSSTGYYYEIALLVPPSAQEIYSDEAKDRAGSSSYLSSKRMDDDKIQSGAAPSAVYESRKESADASAARGEELLKSENEFPAEKAKKSAPADRPQRETIDEIKTATAKLGGKILSGKYNNQTKKMESIILEIPARNYPEFIKKLKNMGTLQKEAPETAQKGSKMQRVKVLLINQ